MEKTKEQILEDQIEDGHQIPWISPEDDWKNARIVYIYIFFFFEIN